jgi:hypothetical protein
MIKRLIQLSTLATGIIMLCATVAPSFQANYAAQAEPISLNGELFEGMTMSDVQHTLGCHGNIWKVERNNSLDTSDPLAWNVQWQISCIYVSNTPEPDQVVSFGAWGTEGSSDRPPNSAFRLMDWKEVG